MQRNRIIDPAAQAAIDTTRRGYYEKNQRRIPLKGQQAHKFSDVEVFDPTKLKAIQDDADEYFDRFYLSSTPCSLYLMDADSLQAAEGLYNPLVLNFANARHPGGGFLNGAQAQEESLCRCSTLYASIASRKAQEMYRFNKEHPSATDSDYMLLSPGVCVFQAQTGELLDEPFCVSVWTMPAPDKYGRAVDVPQAQMDMIMKERLRKFFLAAAKRGYRNLVLGAWGCGAFGHNTKVVAGYFYDLLFGEKYIEFFDTIVFAILHSPDKIRDFAEVFGDKIENFSSNAISAD